MGKLCRLSQLREHAAGALGMDEGDQHAVGARAGGLVDELGAGRLELVQLGLDVIDPIAQMVDARTLLGQELADCRVG